MFYTAALCIGLCYALLSAGLFVSLRFFKIPDITTDGTFTAGAAVSAVLLAKGYQWYTVLPLVVAAGALCGACTAFISNRFKIDSLLAGILVMTALYSVNLTIMGRSNIPLLQVNALIDASVLNGATVLRLGLFASIMVGVLLYLLLTDYGVGLRASGSNADMASAMGINNRFMKTSGLALSNAFTALSGFLIAQQQGYADINMGIGVVITGLAAVLLAESLISILKIRKLWLQLAMVVAGSIAFQYVLALALSLGLHPNWLKGVTALIVLLIVGLSRFKINALHATGK